MPLQQQYKPLLEKIIEDWRKEDSREEISTIILQTVFNSLLRVEQEHFLKYKHGGQPKNNGNKRNGYYNRFVKSLSGTFQVTVPRDRQGLFQPLILEIAKKQQSNIDWLGVSLYSKGLSTRDIQDILKTIYGMQVSPQYISSITKSYLPLREQWHQKKLDKDYYVIYIDALFLPIRRDTVQKEAIYIVLGLKKDLTREILGIYTLPNESASGWKEVVKDLQFRGVKNVLLFVADGLTGLADQVHNVFPNAEFQTCITHVKRKVLNKIRKKDKEEASSDLSKVFKLNDPFDEEKEARKRLDEFIEKWRRRYPQIRRLFPEEKRPYYFTYLKFPYDIRRMIYTTNWIERLNKEIRKVTRNRNSFPNEDSAMTLVWMKLMEMENNVYAYPVTAFLTCEDALKPMFTNLNSSHSQTHNC